MHEYQLFIEAISSSGQIIKYKFIQDNLTLAGALNHIIYYNFSEYVMLRANDSFICKMRYYSVYNMFISEKLFERSEKDIIEKINEIIHPYKIVKLLIDGKEILI